MAAENGPSDDPTMPSMTAAEFCEGYGNAPANSSTESFAGGPTDAPPTIHRSGDTLTLPDVLPGFAAEVSRRFE